MHLVTTDSEILEHLGSEFDFYVAAPSRGEFAEFFKKNAKAFCKLPHRKATLLSLLKLLIFCRQFEVDLIHTHGFGAGVYSFLPALFGIKVVHTFHGLHFQNGLKAKLKTLLESPLSLLRTKHICVSESEQQKAQELSISAIVIPNGISHSTMLNTKSKINWPPLIAGVISRLDPFKNVSWVIKNYEKLALTWPNLLIEIAGEGEERAHLVSLIQKENLESKIKLVGVRAPQSFYEHIDLAIFPSRGEGLPYTVLEAMAFGVPLIASDVPGHNDLLERDVLFSLENPSFVTLAPKSRVISHQSIISKYFDLHANLKKLEKLYRELS